MNLGDLTIRPPVLLAPMAGVTDSPFRAVARRLGCPAVTTEMVSSEGIVRGGRGSLGLLRFEAEEHPIILQLFGSRPDVVAEAAVRCSAMSFDAVDINMGCPVRKVVNHGAGAALMRDPDRAVAIVAAVRKAVSVPVSVKLRAGWSPSEINVVALSRRLEEAGADALTIHPRTRNQFYAGKADWDLIARVVSSVNVPVIGNGDVRTPRDGENLLKQTGCAGIMIGRAAMGNPWLPGALAGAPGRYPPAPGERFQVFCIHLQKMVDWVGSEHRAVLRMRKHLVWYTRGMTGAGALRRALSSLHTAEQMRQAWSDLVQPATDATPSQDVNQGRSPRSCQ